MRQISRHEEGKELEMSRLERGIQDGSHRFPQLPEGPSCEGGLFDLTQLSPKMEFELGGSSRDTHGGKRSMKTPFKCGRCCLKAGFEE